jgi:EF hand
MVRRIRQTKVFWLAAAALLVLVTGAARSCAQSSGSTSGGNAPPQAATGPNQNRDAGERGRRGPGGRSGGRERGSRGSENGNGGGSDPSSGAAAAKTTPSATTPSAPELSDAEKARAWAKEIIKKNDKNGDGLLQESEQSGLGQSAKADANGDHVITMDELVAFASRKPGAPAPGATSSAPAPSAETKVIVADGPAASGHGEKLVKTKTSSRGPNDPKSTNDKLKSYRFKSAKERLPAGLPGWFTSKDANGDGQVEMSEYSKSWTESTAAEFKRYDRDNDGVITAEEALKK